MFDLGFQELVVIFMVALLVFGPKKLPELGRTLGKWMMEIKRGIYSVRLQMESEIRETEKSISENHANDTPSGGETPEIDKPVARKEEN